MTMHDWLITLGTLTPRERIIAKRAWMAATKVTKDRLAKHRVAQELQNIVQLVAQEEKRNPAIKQYGLDMEKLKQDLKQVVKNLQ
jgi:hypothetical protein